MAGRTTQKRSMDEGTRGIDKDGGGVGGLMAEKTEEYENK